MRKELTPAEIVRWLDRHVVGQNEAKRAVAIALRNRYRRRNAREDIRGEIYPSNLIMMGSTGIGRHWMVTETLNRLNRPADGGAADEDGEHGRPDFAVVDVHGEFVEEDE